MDFEFEILFPILILHRSDSGLAKILKNVQYDSTLRQNPSTKFDNSPSDPSIKRVMSYELHILKNY